MGLEIAILGPLEARSDGEMLRVPPGKQRALLCLLVVRAPHPVAAEAAAEALWPEAPPAEATRSLQVTVSRLRRSLAPAGASVETLPSGYRLAVADAAIDARRFEALLERARAARAHDAAAARRLLDEALALWRGPALADAAFEEFAQGEIARLEELRLVALEERLDAAAGDRRRDARRRRARAAGRRAPVARKARRPADARAVSLRAPGRRAGRVHARAPADWTRSSGSSRRQSCSSCRARSCDRMRRLLLQARASRRPRVS